MTPRQATIYQLWCGEKLLAGDALTEEETVIMLEAREVTLRIAHKIMRITHSDHAYIKGQPFE